MDRTVSIIIPAFQNATTIGRTLSAVRAQRHAAWEAIVACDGSTDGTQEIARRFAGLDARIKVLDLPHRGVSATRNAAIAQATGTWLLFLDADDTIEPAFLRHMFDRARTTPDATVIACGYNRIDELGRIHTRHPPLPLHREPLLVCAAGPPGAIHSFLVRHDAVAAAGGFDETLGTNEDWDLWLRIAQAGARFAITRRRLANYWLTPNSLSRDGRQMVSDAGTVQRRALKLEVAAPRGLEAFDRRGFTLDELRLRDAMWSAGVTIGQRKAPEGLFRDIAPSAEHRHQKRELVAKLFEGLVVGTGTGYAALARRWPGLAPDIDRMFAELSRHLGGQDMRPLAQALQIEVARAGRFRGQIDLGLVCGVSLTPRMLIGGYTAPSDVDLAILRFAWLRPATMFSYAAPLLGPLTGADIRRAIRRGTIRRIGTRIARSDRLMTVCAHGWRGIGVMRRAFGLSRPEPPRIPRFSATATLPAPAGPSLPPSSPHALHPGAGADAAQWDRFFGAENPWRYDSPYEQAKYDRTAALLQPRPGRALEIACAEGHFTGRLAALAGEVLALDISAVALERARARYPDDPRISFGQHDLFNDGIPGSWDIITCTEVLYFAPSADTLRRFAARIAKALRPGGQFVHAHAFVAGERPGRTAFDWSDSFGADGIAATFDATPGLYRERSIVTELYRIDRYRAGSAPDEPVTETLDLGGAMAPAAAGDVLWNGALVRRQEAERHRTFRVPVLLYHGIGPAAPAVDPARFEEQLQFLRRRGYRSIDQDRWQAGAAQAGALRGRPIAITFDGIDAAFVADIWPRIRAGGFGAHVFVTPEEVKALGAQTCARLVEEGLGFGSRLYGRAADYLESADLVRVAADARTGLERWLGRSVRWVAPPEGMSDTRIEMMLAAAGFHRVFLDDGPAAWVCGNEMRTPRIEILPETTMAEFAAAVLAPEPPEAADRATGSNSAVIR